ncbi:hypothetical protein HYALB_00010713 [Hymenoscyphus albidus]|uniref:Cytochrome P450 n=1 Tax=Hymenoscyphus albidus TaxID=595503 RepID=A0A9N9M2J2_9HELO|nr:hypothetical protein HYALB_00010713 [Hymenoscyphus albidus]
MIFASSAKHIKELDQAPDSVLSLNGAAKHILQPIYTMNGFNWFDRRGVEGVGFVKTLRTLLTNNLPQLLPRLSIATKTLVWVIHDLCDHPEYVEPLREELQTSYADFERSTKGLPLLDSFLKESARLTPVESMSVRRCALAPFTFSDGTRLAPGDWGCAPSGAINLKEEYYPSPHEFSGFRFVDPAIIPDKQSPQINQGKPSKLVDVDESFLMWGTGRMACPGRYYSSAFMKVIVGQIIMNYDVALVEPSAPRWFSWRAALLPKDHTLVTFTPLEKKI